MQLPARSSWSVLPLCRRSFSAWASRSADEVILAYAFYRAALENHVISLPSVNASGEGKPRCGQLDNPAEISTPSSLNRTQVVFASRRVPRGTYVVPTVGVTGRVFAEEGFGPGYCPDGAWIAFSKFKRRCRSGAAKSLSPRKLLDYVLYGWVKIPAPRTPGWNPHSERQRFAYPYLTTAD